MALDTTESQIPAPGMDRRGVLRALGAGAASTAVAGTLAGGALTLAGSPASAQTLTDTDILNFALNFEYVGAEYYLHGLTGQGLASSLLTGTGTQGTVTAGSAVPFQNPAIRQYVQRLAVDEQAHVVFLRAVLGSAAIAEPTIDLVNPWTTFAVAAGLIQPGQTFDPYASDIGFLLGAYVLEDVCVTALAGAAALLTNKDNLEGAAGLLGVEGYQAGMIRTLLANAGAGVATDAISALRARLSGVGDQGTLTADQPYNFTNTDSNALVYRRTPGQVLAIAYGGGTTSGGLFPNGVNGALTTATPAASMTSAGATGTTSTTTTTGTTSTTGTTGTTGTSTMGTTGTSTMGTTGTSTTGTTGTSGNPGGTAGTPVTTGTNTPA